MQLVQNIKKNSIGVHMDLSAAAPLDCCQAIENYKLPSWNLVRDSNERAKATQVAVFFFLIPG